jgi:hypothetical protein
VFPFVGHQQVVKYVLYSPSTCKLSVSMDIKGSLYQKINMVEHEAFPVDI